MSTKYTKIGVILCIALFSACKSSKIYEVPEAVRPFTGKTIVAPPGMVYIPEGTVFQKRKITDSLDADTTALRVSLSAFFIDQTEVSNKQYRKFVDWVADSIAVTDFLKDPKYFITKKIKSSATKGKGAKDSVYKRINWSKLNINDKVPFWQTNDPNIQSKLIGLVKEENGKKILNKKLVKYIYPRLQFGGPVDTVAIIPDNLVWATDFPNSQSDIMVTNYYSNKAFNNYPVVGVNWKQARSYAVWRGLISGSQAEDLGAFGLHFDLPTESQWQYAATGGESNATNSTGKNVIPSYINPKSKKNLPLANFKQGEGNYTRDGATYTLPVKSYAPNIFGIYNMEGNVAEWTLDAYSPSSREFVDDLNPVLFYDALPNDADVMKRKVVRGGSWKDNAEFLNAETRNFEIQDIPHSYIGFRCIMTAPDLLTDQVKTRTIKAPKKSKKTKLTATN